MGQNKSNDEFNIKTAFQYKVKLNVKHFPFSIYIYDLRHFS